MRLSTITSLVLSGVLLATLPEGGVAQGVAAECVQETNGEYSKQQKCWDGGKRRGRWVVRLPGGEVREGSYVAGKKEGHWVIRLPDGGVQEGPYVAGEKQGHWVLRYADGTVEEGPVVAGLREGRWVAHRPDGTRRAFEMDGGAPVADSVRVVAQAQGDREAAALTRKEDDAPSVKLTLAQVATDAGPPPPRAIREAQALLAGLGYAPGPADGIWGRRTGQAYRAFLRDAGLPDAERLTPEALQAMRVIAQRAGVTPGGAAPAARAAPEAPRESSGTGVVVASTQPSTSASLPPAALPPDILHRAAQAGDIVGLEAALTAGAAVDARDGRGWTALMYTVNKGYTLLVEPLLAAGADPDVRAPDGATALFMAVVHGHTEIIELLSNRGADVSIRGPKGKTAVDVARTRYGDPDVARQNGEAPAVLALLQGETLEGLAYGQARTTGTAAAYAEYLTTNPRGRHADEARRLRVEAEERERREAEEARRRAEERERRRVEEERRKAEEKRRKAEEHERLAEAGKRLARRWPAGTKLRDCKKCPELVVVPPGSFMMGSPPAEARRNSSEGPVHRVTLLPFAVGIYEVTFDEWNACVRGGGCGKYKPDNEGWGRGRRPVVNVSWRDAKAYVRWLSEKTGEPYRLLSESEWEYVARAGTTGPFHTGATISTKQANYDGNYTYGSGRKGRFRKKTMKVGSYPPNGYGLHDVHGNVREWVEDCWNGSYEGAPEDGSAWESGNCGRRVLRGGGWSDAPRNLRSAHRYMNTSGLRYDYLGFRVARTLTP